MDSSSSITEKIKVFAVDLAEGLGGLVTAEQVVDIYTCMAKAVNQAILDEEGIFALISPSELVSASPKVRELHCAWAAQKGAQRRSYALTHEQAGALFDELSRLTALLNHVDPAALKARTEEPSAQSADRTAGIRILPGASPRVETGAVQFGDDWPGMFIRGDNAAHYAMNLQLALCGRLEDAYVKCALEGLLSDLLGSNLADTPLPST